ncbi:helix-turn-helix domain-containing protein [Streptomyces adustus]
MAARAGMSVRTFSRRFLAETGQTPGQWLTAQRLELARRLLEFSDLPVDRVAEQAGFGSASSLRQHLSAAIGVSPAAYRRTFQGRDHGPAAGRSTPTTDGDCPAVPRSPCQVDTVSPGGQSH